MRVSRPTFVLLWISLALSATLQIYAGGPPDRESRLVVLPFDDLSGSEDAARTIRADFVRAVEAKGWSVADLDSVEKLLEAERVRYFDSLDESVRVRVLESTGASAVVSGAVHTFTGGRNPTVAVSARMVRATGAVVWGNVAGVTSDDTEAAFGFARKTTPDGVATNTVATLLRGFPNPSGGAKSIHAARERSQRADPHVFTAPLTTRGRIRICVLPFVNYSSTPEAAQVVEDVLVLRLAGRGEFEVVEPATLRGAALAHRIGTFRFASNDHLATLADDVGTTLFITGSIFDYADASGSQDRTPTIDLEFSLIDVRTASVVWSTQHSGKGIDYTGFLLRGTVSSVVELTDRVVSEMIRSGERGLSKEPRPVAAQRARLHDRPERRSQFDSPRKENKP